MNCYIVSESCLLQFYNNYRFHCQLLKSSQKKQQCHPLSQLLLKHRLQPAVHHCQMETKKKLPSQMTIKQAVQIRTTSHRNQAILLSRPLPPDGTNPEDRHVIHPSKSGDRVAAPSGGDLSKTVGSVSSESDIDRDKHDSVYGAVWFATSGEAIHGKQQPELSVAGGQDVYEEVDPEPRMRIHENSACR